jgi:hypothetical protein
MRFRACPLTLALLIVLAPATAQSADCSSDLDLVADQLQALDMAAQSGPTLPARSGRAITQNRMATASQNAYSATLPQADVTPSGAEGRRAGHPAVTDAEGGWTPGPTNIFARAQSAWQAARAADSRSDEVGCLRELADARQLIETLN